MNKKVVVTDRIQRGYVCTEPIGRNFARAFTAGLTPKDRKHCEPGDLECRRRQRSRTD